MHLKRLLDFCISLFGLLFFSWLILITWFVASIATKSNGFFIQKRIGKDGKLFTLIKIKTMKPLDGIKTTVTTKNDVRITPFGEFLRKWKFDELPSLWNVMKGDMSLVGPRPLLMEYLPLYSKEQMRRHEVKPGITGWAQINGRNTISWDEKFKLDVWYVDNQSIWLDTKILFITAWKVLKREGISQKGHVTMERFRGSK